MPREFASPSPLVTQSAFRFMQQWTSGARPQIEHYLALVPSTDQETLFQSLLTVEINARQGKNEKPISAEYLNRFPQYRSIIVSALGEPLQTTPSFPATVTPTTIQPTFLSQSVPTVQAIPMTVQTAFAAQMIPVAPLPAGVSVMPVAMPLHSSVDHRAKAFEFGEMDDSSALPPDQVAEWEEKQTRKLSWVIGLSLIGIVSLGVTSALLLLPSLRRPTVADVPIAEASENTTPTEQPKNVIIKTETKNIDLGGPKSTGDIERDMVDWLREIGGSGFVVTDQGGRVRYTGGQNMPKLNKFTVEQISLNAEASNRWNDRSIARFSELKELKKLELFRDKDLSDETLTPLVGTAKLKHLELRGQDLRITGAGIARFPEIENLVINNAPSFNDADCAAIAVLMNLTSLELNGTKITEAGFGHLGKLPKLKSLSFGPDLTLSPNHVRVLQTAPIEEIRAPLGMTDEVFTEFAVFPNMRKYTLRKTSITSTGFKAVKGQIKLEEISIDGSALTMEALKNVSELSALTKLELPGGKLEGDGLQVLAELTNLKVINLARNPLTDADVGKLATVDTMELLDLSGTKITDGALGALKKHQKLKRLIVKGTMVTAGGIKEFEAGTPQCKVEK